jgi:hypothetical protein
VQENATTCNDAKDVGMKDLTGWFTIIMSKRRDKSSILVTYNCQHVFSTSVFMFLIFMDYSLSMTLWVHVPFYARHQIFTITYRGVVLEEKETFSAQAPTHSSKHVTEFMT